MTKSIKTLYLPILVYLFKTSYCGDHTYTFGGKKFHQTEFVPDSGEGPKFSMPGDSNDPTLIEQGIYFGIPTHLLQNESFTYTGSDFSIELWTYNFDVKYQNIYSAEVQGSTNRNINILSSIRTGQFLFYCYTDTQNVGGMPAKLGWNKIGCKFTNGVPAGYSVNKLATIDGILVTKGLPYNNMKLGCFSTCVNGYIIYSFKFKATTDLGNSVNSFSVINPYYTCGDGIIQTINIEHCDDGGYINGDTCNEGCLIESSPCISNPLSCLTVLLPEVCGDGLKTTSEVCDDGDIIDGDGCDSSCQVEHNWICSGGNDTAPTTCNLCELDYCLKCETETQLKCAECETDYKLDKNNHCVHKSVILMSDSAKQLASSTTAVSAVGASASIVVSFLNIAFPAALWSMINQMQLLQLLLLLNCFIPDDAKGMLAGNKQASLNMSFIPLVAIPYFDELINLITFDQENIQLKSIGFVSGSSLTNCIHFLFILSLIMLAHSIVCCLPKFKLEEDSNNWRKALNFCVKKLVEFFAFTLYIRTTFESYQFLLLANISNVYEFDTSNTTKIIALAFSLFVLLCLSIFIFCSFYTFYVLFGKDLSTKRLKSEEFVGGIKTKNIPRLYSFLSLARRAAMVVLLICGETLDSNIITAVLVLILASYLLYLILVRPFKETNNNIIEIINEIFLILITLWLCIFNQEDDWNNCITSIYMFIIMGNTLVITLIVLAAFFIKIVKYCANKCCKKKKNRVMIKPTVIQIGQLRKIPEPSPNMSVVQSNCIMTPAPMNVDRELAEFYSKRN